MVDENDRLRQVSQDTVDKTCRYGEFQSKVVLAQVRRLIFIVN